MPRESPYFNCGELKPISVLSFPGGGVNPGGNTGDPNDPGVVIATQIPLDPLRGREWWTCTCREEIQPPGECVGCTGEQICGLVPAGSLTIGPVFNSFAACVARSSQFPPCIASRATCDVLEENCDQPPYCSDPVDPVRYDKSCRCLPPGQRQITEFATLAECRRSGCINDPPCEYERRGAGYRCEESPRRCPDGSVVIKRECVWCDCYGAPPCDFRTLEECQMSDCVSNLCPDDPRQGYKCVDVDVLTCPEPNERFIQATIRDCQPCTLGLDPECRPVTIETCREGCLNDECRYICIGAEQECVSPEGEAIILTGGRCTACLLNNSPVGAPPIDPNCRFTSLQDCQSNCTLPICKYECKIINVEFCPPPFETTQRIIKECLPCVDPDREECTYTSLEECTQSPFCQDQECETSKFNYKLDATTNSCRLCTISEIRNNDCQYRNIEDCLRDLIQQTDPIDPRGESSQFNNGSVSTKINLKLNRIEKTVNFSNNLETQEDKTIEDIYNFYQYPQSEYTRFVNNPYYLNIFNNVVAEEVLYFLEKKYTNRSDWSEKYYYNLTPSKISQSLREDILLAISNIYGSDSSIIDLDNFLQVIKRLIITNKLDEFDPNFYKDLFRKQQLNPPVEYIFPKEKELKQRSALGLLAQEAISANPVDHNNYFKFVTLRKKRFNTDINATISLTTESNQDLFIPLKDAGIEFTTNDASSFIPIGYGDNYFIPFYNLNDAESELPLDSDLDKSWYVTDGARLAAFNALGVSAICDITVSSNNNQHEFISAYELSTVLEPMYFALVLSTVETLSTTNQYVTETVGTYQRLTSLTSINQHITNYGLTAKRVNVDYRDPFIHYAKETGKLSIKYNDITFKYFDNQLPIPSEVNSDILTRTAPIGLILVPGCGSRHNPYHATSELTSVSGSKVSRTFKGSLGLNLLLDNQYTLSGSTTQATLYPPKENYGFADRLSFSFNSETYNNTYFVNGQYQSTPPIGPINKPITSYIVNDIADKLITAYNPKELKWFDIYSRLKVFEMGEIFYNATPKFVETLSSGWRGKQVKDVTRERNDKITFIDYTIVPEINIPEPIITKENRFTT